MKRSFKIAKQLIRKYKFAADVLNFIPKKSFKDKQKEHNQKLIEEAKLYKLDPDLPYFIEYFKSNIIKSFLNNNAREDQIVEDSLNMLKDKLSSVEDKEDAKRELHNLVEKYDQITNEMSEDLSEDNMERERAKVYEFTKRQKDYPHFYIKILYPSFDENDKKYFDEKNGVKQELTITHQQLQDYMNRALKGELRVLDSYDKNKAPKRASLVDNKPFWVCKVEGINKWFKVKDIRDTKIPAEQEGGGNLYYLEGVDAPVHQSKILELEECEDDNEFEELNRTLKASFKFAQVKPLEIPKEELTVMRARRFSPRYFDAYKLQDSYNKIKSILKTNGSLGSDQFYKDVMTYQKQKGIVVDGIVGPITYGKMREDDKTLPEIKEEAPKKLTKEELDKIKADPTFDKDRFKRRIAHLESRGRYDVENPKSSAVGKYQFLWNSWGSKIKAFSGKKDLTKEQFKNNPKLQEEWMDYYTIRILLPETEKLLSQYPNKGIKNKEWLAGMIHFQGYGRVNKYMKQGTDTVADNINPISMTGYADKMMSIS